MPLTLLVPGLLGAGAPRVAELERWLARADVEHAPAGEAEDWLARLFGVPEPVPYAALSMAGEQVPVGGTWLRADPVHLEVRGDGLVLHEAAALAIEPAEARELAAALSAHFAADALEILVAAPDRWYVRVPEGEAPRTTPLHRAAGHDVFGLLPSNTARLNWRSALTEAQMMLAAHPVNAAREAARRPTVNSLWIWGEGALPPRVAHAFTRTWGDSPVLRGLALAADALAAPAPRSLAQLEPSPLEPVLVLAPRVDDAWLGGLADALARFGSVRVVLPGAARSLDARLSPAARWRWWRRPRPLDSHA